MQENVHSQPAVGRSEPPLARRVPASALRTSVREHIELFELGPLNDYDLYGIEMRWALALHEFDIPIAFTWSELPDTGPKQRIPRELTLQLIGQKVGAGLSVIYFGKRYLVVDTWKELGTLGDTIATEPHPLTLYLADAQCIDLEA